MNVRRGSQLLQIFDSKIEVIGYRGLVIFTSSAARKPEAPLFCNGRHGAWCPYLCSDVGRDEGLAAQCSSSFLALVTIHMLCGSTKNTRSASTDAAIIVPKV